MLKKTTLILTVAGAFIIAGVATAQVKQGKTRPARTSHLMKGAIKPSCDALKKAIDSAPADEKAWKALAVNAAMLNETSYALMEDGRCPDDKWANANKLLQGGSAELLKAIEGKDHTLFRTAFGTAMKSCKACHDAHKEK